MMRVCTNPTAEISMQKKGQLSSHQSTSAVLCKLSGTLLQHLPLPMLLVVGGLVVVHTDADVVGQMLPRMKKIKSSKGGGEGGMWMWNYYCDYYFLVHQQKERPRDCLLTYSIAKLESTTLFSLNYMQCAIL